MDGFLSRLTGRGEVYLGKGTIIFGLNLVPHLTYLRLSDLYQISTVLLQ